jgi:hypothetical protein
MKLGSNMQLELTLSNEPRAMPGVEAFVHATLQQFALADDAAVQLQSLVVTAVRHAVDDAYPQGEEGLIKLQVCEQRGKLEIFVRDFGLPQDVARLEQYLHAGASPAAWLHAAHTVEAVDEIHWLAFGPQGKALQLVKWLPAAHIAETSSPDELAARPSDVTLAPPQNYDIRRMRPDEAVQVSQLMYRTYGNTYFNEDVYYPERIAAQNEHGVLVSVVAIGDNGRVAGHCALECEQAGPVAELGQAAVDPAHRGRGLLDKMKALLENEARARKLVGWFANAVAVHTLTQQSEAHHGGHVCGVDLGVSPKTEAFRNIDAQLTQRVSCITYFHWLEAPPRRMVFVSERHREMAAAIYANLRCPVELCADSPTMPVAAHGTFAVKFDSRAGCATIRVETYGDDTAAALRHAIRQLVEQSRAEAVFVELPLAEAKAVDIGRKLEACGLAFCGIGPHFSASGDVLKLCYNVEPLSAPAIKVFEPFAEKLRDYALQEQNRIRDAI